MYHCFPIPADTVQALILSKIIAHDGFAIKDMRSGNATITRYGKNGKIDCYPHDVARLIADCTPYNDNVIASIVLGNEVLSSGHTVSVTRIIWNTRGNHAKV